MSYQSFDERAKRASSPDYQSFDEYAKESKRTIQTLRAVCEHLLYGGQGDNKELYKVIAMASDNIRTYMDTINMLERVQERMASQPKEYFTGLWLTYEEWKARGYQVQSGEKALWKKGIPMFSENQVRKGFGSLNPKQSRCSC